MRPRSGQRSLRILITAGPTREYFDPVRFITNKSTGLIGYTLARRAVQRGHRVILLAGPTHLPPPSGARVYRFETAEQLRILAERFFSRVDAVIATAAVGDFRPLHRLPQKIKKEGVRTLIVPFVKTPDVLKSLGSKKQRQVVVGFSLETDNTRARARQKLRSKNLDFIVANSLSARTQAFGNASVCGMIIDRDSCESFRSVSKHKLAGNILDRVEKVCYSQKT